MLVATVVVLAIAALGGITAAVIRVRSGTNPPTPVALAHGAAAAAGLVVLIVAGATDTFTGALITGLVLLAAAALGGFVLFAGHLRDRLLALPLVGLHALLAVAGFVAVVVALAS